MKRMIGLLAMALVTCAAIAAQKPKPGARYLVKSQEIYYQTWEEGEEKSCSTYDDTIHIVSCDETISWSGSFVQLLAKVARETLPNVPEATHKDRIHVVLQYESENSKKFETVFATNPWPTPPLPIAKGHWNDDTLWECVKVAGKVSCKFPEV